MRGATHAVFGLILLVFGVGITPLNHEVWNDAMKDRLVIKPRLGEGDKILHVLRRFIREETDLNTAEFRVNYGPGLFTTGCLSFHVCAPSGSKDDSKYDHPDEHPTNNHRHAFLFLSLQGEHAGKTFHALFNGVE